jgi:hypothetical protein
MKQMLLATALCSVLLTGTVTAQTARVQTAGDAPRADSNREMIELLKQVIQKLEAQRGTPAPRSATTPGGNVRLWDLATGQEPRTPEGPRAAGAPGTIRLWDAATGKELAAATGNKGVASVAFSPDGKRLAVGQAGTVSLWDAATGKELSVPAGSKGVASLAFSPDGKLIAVGAGGTVRLLDAASGKEVRAMPGANPVVAIGFSPDGKVIAVADKDTVHLFDLASGKEMRAVKVATRPASISFSPDGKLLPLDAGKIEVNTQKVRTWLERAAIIDALAKARQEVAQAQERLDQAAATVRRLEALRDQARALRPENPNETRGTTEPKRPGAGKKMSPEQRQELERRLDRLMRELEALRRELPR